MMRRFRLFPRLKTLFLADAGHVAVEYALTAPILLGIIYGIVEVSHYAFLKMTISNAAHARL
jgi:Flp pilus assembly protein TadG